MRITWRRIISLVLAVLGQTPVLASGAEKLNVLLIISDDLRPELGCYGSPLGKTPHIDALAATGVRFDRAYCQFPLCNPSRVSMLNSRQPVTTGIIDNRKNFRDTHPEFVSLPQHFKAHGYATLRTGKIFHGGIDDPLAWTEGGDRPGQRPAGDDQAQRGERGGARVLTVQNPPAPAQGKGKGQGQGRPLTQAERSDRWLVLEGNGENHGDYNTADRAIAFLNKFKDQTFFLACGFVKPHSPPTAPRKYYDLYDPAAIPLPPDFAPRPTVPPGFPRGAIRPRNADLFIGRDATPQAAREMIRAYLASVAWMDWNTGRVLAELDRLGLRDKTIIVFWGDHGYQLGEKGKWSKAGSVWEKGTRVPLIVAAPGARGNGRACSRVVQSIDIYPTLADLCALPRPVGLEGASLAPLLADPAAPWDRPAFSAWSEDGRNFTAVAVRTESWRYAEFDGGKGGAMLLDPKADPDELRNLADDPQYQGVRAELSALVSARGQVLGQTVTVDDDPAAFTLSNGIVTARVSKRSGDLTSLQFKGTETLNDRSGHAGGYWSHDTTGGKETVTRVTIDPRSNGGERGEVSVKGISGGVKMGHGPGAAQGGDFPADIEIRYTLGRDDPGVYACCIFDHQPTYPAAAMTEARYCAKLADTFDWMTIDARRNRSFPADLHEGDKYIYTAVQYDHPVYGWSSTTKGLGFWLINPSLEYLSGGPTKVEFLCHRDTTQVAAACVLNYWRSSHYGGASVAVGADEHWTKVIGPFFLYINSGGDPQALWQDATRRARQEAARWPYDWVAGVDYPRRSDRALVTGQLVLNDPQKPGASTANLLVGLTHAAYASPVARAGAPGPARPIDWQTDAKHYEFWARGDDQGGFTIPNVRAGNYTLHALADGVLGEYAKTDITVEPGKPLDLGKLPWTPVRHGKPLWEVGIPNRNGSEFFKGDEYADPSISLEYARLFPDDVNYVIGKSDFRKDWFFQHVPHNEDPAARPVPYGGIRGNGRATPYAITFDLEGQPHGQATLRLALCGTGARTINVEVNGRSAGLVDRLIGDGAIARHSSQGLWYERELSFDASLLKPGTNVLKLIVPAGPINNGVIYDYLRLELDDR